MEVVRVGGGLVGGSAPPGKEDGGAAVGAAGPSSRMDGLPYLRRGTWFVASYLLLLSSRTLVGEITLYDFS